MKNFELVSKILAEIASKLIRDGHPIVAEFVNEDPPTVTVNKSQEWKGNHVCKAQYLLQIIKRTDKSYCLLYESSYLKVIYPSLLDPERREKIKPFNGSVSRFIYLFNLFVYLFIYLLIYLF